MDIKNIFIYNALPSDEIAVDNHIVKAKGKPVPTVPVVRDHLRITFSDDFKMAVAFGMTDSLDSIHLNMDDWRAKPGNAEGRNNMGTEARKAGDTGFPIYGRRRTVHMTFS